MDHVPVESEIDIAEASAPPKRKWTDASLSWLGRCSGVAAGYSANVAGKAGSMFESVGRATVKTLAKTASAKKVFMVRTSDLVKPAKPRPHVPGFFERYRMLREEMLKVLNNKETVVWVLFRGNGDPAEAGVEAGIWQREEEDAGLDEVIEVVPEETQKQDPPENPVTAAPCCEAAIEPVQDSASANNPNEDHEAEEVSDCTTLEASVDEASVDEVQGDNTEVVLCTQEPDPLPEHAKLLSQETPTSRRRHLTVEEVAQDVEFTLASEKTTFLGIIRGLERSGVLSQTSLKKLQAMNNPAAELLCAALSDHPDEETRVRSIGFLADRQYQDARPIFERATADGSALVRAAALSGLYKILGDQAIPRLTRSIKDEDHGVRHRVAVCLGWTTSPDAVPHLINMMADTDVSVRRAVMGALGVIKSKASIPRILSALDDEDMKVREAAYRTLKEITLQDLPFNPNASAEGRAADRARWQAWWQADVAAVRDGRTA